MSNDDEQKLKFISQPSKETPIWRYLDYYKFISLIYTKSLFFCQASKFSDAYEGSMKMREEAYKDGDYLKEVYKKLYDSPSGHRSHTVISCWHMNEYESEAMWGLYLPSSNQRLGVAIKSSVGNLQQSLGDVSDIGALTSGKVIYQKLQPPILAEKPVTQSTSEVIFFYKRPELSHECEYRVIIACRDIDNVNANGGVFVGIQLDKLIQKIVIHPHEPYQHDIQKGIEDCLKYHKLEIKVEKSSLRDKPDY